MASGRRLLLLRVWATALRVLASYGLFRVGKSVRGEGWAEQALPRFHRANARRVLRTVLRVRGLFIKVGQLVSVLAAALPADFRSELEALQDRIPARPWSEVREQLRSELGADVESRFSAFEPDALAAASLAQVHAATLADGRRVAVKVRHAGIEELARVDLSTARRILRLVAFFTGARGLDEVFDEVRAMIEAELDFAREADHAEAIGAALADEPGVSAPRVVREVSSHGVLVTELVDGAKLTDGEALDASGIDRTELAERILRAYCRMIFEDGVYHADPHPGNFLVRPDGELVFLDFGAVGRVTPAMREGIPRLVEGILKHDRQVVLRTLRQMGFVQNSRAGTAKADDVAQRIIDYVYSRFLEDFDLDSWRVGEVRFDASAKFEVMADLKRMDLWVGDLTATFRAPREWILLLRTVALLLGVCTELDPELQPLSVTRPYIERLVLSEGQDWLRLLRGAVKDWAVAAITLPGDMHRVLGQAERGELAVEVRGLRESADLLYTLGHQLLWGLAALGTGALAYAARSDGDSAVAEPLTWVCGLSLLALGRTLWKARRLRRAVRRGSAR